MTTLIPFSLLLALMVAGGAVAAPAKDAAARAEPANSAINPTGSRMAFGTVNAAGRFDLSVNNAPAAQVYMQIGYDTAYNVLVNPDVTGSISIAAQHDRARSDGVAARTLWLRFSRHQQPHLRAIQRRSDAAVQGQLPAGSPPGRERYSRHLQCDHAARQWLDDQHIDLRKR